MTMHRRSHSDRQGVKESLDLKTAINLNTRSQRTEEKTFDETSIHQVGESFRRGF